jgi:hypothetical protein
MAPKFLGTEKDTYFSINEQFICNLHLGILDVVVRWPGSTHDATIFNNSRLKGKFEDNNYVNFVLLGDSGYANNSPSKSWHSSKTTGQRKSY